MRCIPPILCFMIIMFSLTGCAGQAAAPATLKDRAGNDINVPANITKIISMSPSNTEILTALGQGSKIVAADTNSESLPGLNADTRYFDMLTPDIEQLISLKPDVILATSMSMVEGEDPFKPLKDAGICVAYIETSNTIQDIQEDILFIAELTGTSAEAQKIIADMQAEIGKIRAIGETITDKKTVFFEISPMPYLYSFGTGVFLDEMLSIIGAENILADQQSWVSISEEAVLAKNPDVIMTTAAYMDDPVGEIKGRAGWESVTAVKNNDVYYIDSNAATLPNQNIVKALKEMAHAVYPDVMAAVAP